MSALSHSEFELLGTYFELVTMSRGQVLFEANEKLQYIYFPITAVVSSLCCQDGTTVEVTMVSNEGMLGVSSLMGTNEALTQAIIIMSGQGYRESP